MDPRQRIVDFGRVGLPRVQHVGELAQTLDELRNFGTQVRLAGGLDVLQECAEKGQGKQEDASDESDTVAGLFLVAARGRRGLAAAHRHGVFLNHVVELAGWRCHAGADVVFDFEGGLDDFALGDGNLLGFVPSDEGRITGQKIEFFGHNQCRIFAVGGVQRADPRAGPDEAGFGHGLSFRHKRPGGSSGRLSANIQITGISSCADRHDNIVRFAKIAQRSFIGRGPSRWHGEPGDHGGTKDRGETLDGAGDVFARSKKDGTAAGFSGQRIEIVVGRHGYPEDVHGTADFLGRHDGTIFVADLAIGNDQDGGRMLAAMRLLLRTEVLESWDEFRAASHPDAVNGRSVGTEVDVGRADQFGFVVADAALEEREPDAGVGVQARDKGREGFACAGPVVAAHAAAAIQEEIDVGGRSRGGVGRGFGQTDLKKSPVAFIQPRTDNGHRGAFFIPREDEVAVGQVAVDGQSGQQVLAFPTDDDGMAG